jgi:hypothetical protein
VHGGGWLPLLQTYHAMYVHTCLANVLKIMPGLSPESPSCLLCSYVIATLIKLGWGRSLNASGVTGPLVLCRSKGPDTGTGLGRPVSHMGTVII